MQACFNDIRQVVCLGDELHLSAESSRHTNTQTFSQRHNYTDTQAYYFILRQNALFLCKVENILRNSLTDDILCRILPYILMFSWEILYSKDLLPSYHLAHHPTLPSIPPCLPYHPALHPTLPTTQSGEPSHPALPANQPRLPALLAKQPCPPMLHSHVSVACLERDQGRPHPPVQAVCVNVRSKVYFTLTMNSPKYLTNPPNVLCNPLKILRAPQISFILPKLSYVSQGIRTGNT